MYKTIITSLLFVILLLSAGCSKQNLNETIAVEQGLLKGILNEKGDILVFKGVPFAAPPVGDLRWKPPQEPAHWKGSRDCSSFAPSAMQSTPVPFDRWTSEYIAPAEPLSEDCLYLNIWTKAGSIKEKRPVLVYIHGGAFTGGSGSVPAYDGEAMAEKGLVFITINYRLGILGFLVHPDLTAESPDHASGNYGLLDQLEALHWIKKNISAFGGDPDKVTIAGQSAGASSVSCLYASPLAKGYISGVIAESGGKLSGSSENRSLPTLAVAEEAAGEVDAFFGVNGIDELRKIPADELIKVPYRSRPIIDGLLLTDQPWNLFDQGLSGCLPLLIGWNTDEGMDGGEDIDTLKLRQVAEEKFGDRAQAFLDAFPAHTSGEAYDVIKAASVYAGYGRRAFEWMEVQNNKGCAPVYIYNFSRKVPYGEGQKDYGAFHSGEVAYAYGNLLTSPIRPWTETDFHLSDVMSEYWANFARNGDPGTVEGINWPACAAPDYQVMYLGDSIVANPLNYLEGMKFLCR